MAGSPARFLCEASESTAAVYWTYDGKVISNNASGHFVVRNISSATSVLTIYKTTSIDTGTLMCLSDGVLSNPISITVGE